MKTSKKIIIVMPAYFAEKTLKKTFNDIPAGSYDEIILVDDASSDKTLEIAASLGIRSIAHPANLGYGGNQKTCYKAALTSGADIVVMLHPDYQYDPKAVPQIVEPLLSGKADFVIASRFLKDSPHAQGMPLYKYIGNRFLTFLQNTIFGLALSEYHSGYRAYTRELLEKISFQSFSDNFVFDSQMVAKAAGMGLRFSEISVPTRYFPEASQTSFRQSVRYGLSTLGTLFDFVVTYRKKAFAGFLGIIALVSAFFWSSVFPQGRPLEGDALEFHSLATSILERGEFGGGEWFASENPSMWREPGYPLFLAGTYAIFGRDPLTLLFVQSLLYAISAILLFLAFTRLTKPWIAGLSALSYALMPAIAYRAGYVGSDLLFTVLLIGLSFAASTHHLSLKRASLLGVITGITALIRTIGILLPIAFIIYIFLSPKKLSERIRLSVFYMICFFLLVVPWMTRNQIQFGEFALTNRSGLLLHSRGSVLSATGDDYASFVTASFLGDYITSNIFPEYNREKARKLSGLESRDLEVDLFVRQHYSPSELDKKLKIEGISMIKEKPARYLLDTMPWLARLNAPIIPRSSTQALFVTSKKTIPEFIKISIILALRLGMYIFLGLIFFAAIRRLKHVWSPVWLFIFIAIILNLGNAAFAAVERFSMPLYPFYFLFFWESIALIFASRSAFHLSLRRKKQPPHSSRGRTL